MDTSKSKSEKEGHLRGVSDLKRWLGTRFKITSTWILCFTILPWIKWLRMDTKIIAQTGWRTFIIERQGQRSKITPIFRFEYNREQKCT